MGQEINIPDYVYVCYSPNQYKFFSENGETYFRKFKNCNNGKTAWLFANNDKIKELRKLWTDTYPYERRK